MKRAVITVLVAALLIARGLSQDLDFTAIPKLGGPGGSALSRMTNLGAVSGLANPGLLGTAVSSESLLNATDIAVGDFNADGIGDVVVAQGLDGGGRVTVFSGEGDGSFGLPISIPVMNKPTSIASADIDMDSRADIVVAGVDYSGDVSGQIEVFSGRFLSEGTPNPMETQWLDGRPVDVTINRLNGDAFGDIAVAFSNGDGSGGVQVVFGGASSPSGAMTFAGGGTQFLPEMPTALATGTHVSGRGGPSDTTPDLFVATSGGVGIFDVSTPPGGASTQFLSEGQVGADFFGQGTLTFDTGGPGGIVVGDFNNDDISDIGVLNSGSGDVSTFIGNDNGSFQAAVNVTDTGLISGFTLIEGGCDVGNDCLTGVGPDGDVRVLRGDDSGAFHEPENAPWDWPNVMVQVLDHNGFRFTTGGSPMVRDEARIEKLHIHGSGGTLDVMDFCEDNPEACGGNGLSLPGRQTGVSAGTSPPANAALIRGHEGHEARRFDVIRRLGRRLSGLLTFGHQTHRASARFPTFGGAQMRGQVEPALVIFSATGNSSGDFLRMEIIDTSGQVHRGALPEGIVLEPIAVPRATPPADASVTTQDVAGFCLDFGKDVPAPGARYRIASPAAQKAGAPIRNVLAATKQLALRNLLHSDGSPGYLNFIRQYAVWAKRENWDIKKFGESFVERTKQNVLSMKVNWTDVMEQGVRAAIPGRWRDIEEVLRLSNQIATAPAR